MRKIYLSAILAVLFTFSSVSLYAETYEQRREAYIQTALNNTNGDLMTLQAYKGIPVDQTILSTMLEDIKTNTVADFSIVKLIRVLFFSNGAYDAQILPVLDSIPFWLTRNETSRVYWSENHMIMWMSSDWLLHERYGRPIDASLRNRLTHFLRLKIDYGYYEFFSSVYLPYSLSGLLNLADFAEDEEIKSLATQAAQRLLKDLLLLTNDKGTFFPPAGRNYYSKYATPYGQNHNNLIYLLTGMGQVPTGVSHAGGFLASSTLPVEDVIASWTPDLNTTYKIGHTLREGFNLNRSQTKKDKVIFQWSSGAYFHPSVANQTLWLINSNNLWGHSEFDAFPLPNGAPAQLGYLVATIAGSVSKSSVICGQDVDIFKKGSVTLASVQDFWKGHLGFQQWPWMANTGTGAVFTASGEVSPVWGINGDVLNSNNHLPYVDQNKNVALIMYRPNTDLALFGFSEQDVALHWPANRLSETREHDMWILGREDNSYVAVRRHCTGTVNGIMACEDTDGQTWAVIVGNSDMYGSFDNFEDIIDQAQYEERWYYDNKRKKWAYFGKISVDGTTISHTWYGVGAPADARLTLEKMAQDVAGDEVTVYPNPARGEVYIDLSNYVGQPADIRITNMLGQEVHRQVTGEVNDRAVEINAAGWANGLYIVSVESGGKRVTQKLMISQ